MIAIEKSFKANVLHKQLKGLLSKIADEAELTHIILCAASIHY